MFSCGITEPGIDCERQQQEQHQRRAHRGELAPRPPGQLAGREVARERGRLTVVGGPLPEVGLEVGHTGTVNPWTTCSWSHCTMRSHQPVTSRMPTRIIITPPRRTTSIWWRRTTANAPSMRR